MPKWKRFWRLWYALESLISSQKGSTGHMQKLCGHLVNHMGIARCSLAVLDKVYVFMDFNDDKIRRFPKALVDELKIIQGLLVMCFHDAGLPAHSRAYCGDASEEGYALHWTWCSAAELLDASQWRERGRFQVARPRRNMRDETVCAGALAGTPSPCPAFEEWVDL